MPVANSFDHLVGADQQRRWDGDAERLRGREIDHQLILGRLLYRQLAWSVALENLVDVGSGAAIEVGKVRTIAQQMAGLRELSKGGNRRKPIPESEFCHECPAG